MKQFRSYVLILFIMVVLFSYGNGSERIDDSSEGKSIQKVSENSISNGGFLRYNDVVDLLYDELVKKTPELKMLEVEIENYHERYNLVHDEYVVFNNKSSSYYNSSFKRISSISDSTLKSKIYSMMVKINNGYMEKYADITSVTKLMERV